MSTSSDSPIDPNKELTGLDKIVEVIGILVLKFGRATSALIAVGIMLVLCLVTLVTSMVQSMVIRSEMRDLLDRQELLIKSQGRLEKASSSTQKVLTDTLQKVVETQAKIETVAETTPKIKVDSKTGKTKLVIQKTVPVKEVSFNIATTATTD
jgi:hypothetical protein